MQRPSASLVVATAALFVSLGGTGIAATHYLITSTKQISPRVLKKLEKRGPRGANGMNGTDGTNGIAGTTGTFDASNVTIVDGPTVSVFVGGSAAQSVVSCPAGDTVIGGGYQPASIVYGSTEQDGPTSASTWAVEIAPIVVSTPSGSGFEGGGAFYAQAVCAS